MKKRNVVKTRDFLLAVYDNFGYKSETYLKALRDSLSILLLSKSGEGTPIKEVIENAKGYIQLEEVDL